MVAVLDEVSSSGLKAPALMPDTPSGTEQNAGHWHLAVAFVVVVVHGFALWVLLQHHRVLVHPEVAVTLLFIETPKGELPADSPALPRLAPIKAHLVFEAPQLPVLTEAATPSDTAMPIPAPAMTAPVPAMQSGPMALSDELAVFCPSRSPPTFPLQSKHLHEQGEVTLRVELDEQGRVSDLGIVKSSGFTRLDEAARAAVLTWRCNAALRDGKPVRAVAIQTLEFVLERR